MSQQPARLGREAPMLDWDWRLRARCRDQPPDMFFTSEHENPVGRLERELRAKEVCEGCPVLESCREYALDAREAYGIWGALTPLERRLLLARERY
jgi:WhiB family transcriptional regulator, redox-sensing transcriptional regulator